MNLNDNGGKKLFEGTMGKPDGDKTRTVITYFDPDGTYRELTAIQCMQATHAVARRLRTLAPNLPHGTWVGLSAGIHPLWFPVMFGLLEAGFNVLMLNHDFNEERTALCVRLGGLKLVVTDEDFAFEGAQVIDFSQLTENPFEEFDQNSIDEGEPWGSLLGTCTSGTTGDVSKFPVMSASKMMDSFLYTEKSMRNYPLYWEDACKGGMERKPALVTVPLHHVYGGEFSMFFMHMNMPVCLRDTKSVMEMLRIIKEREIWMFPTVPLIWKTFYQIMVGRFGAATPAAFEELFGRNFGVGVSAGDALDPNVRAGFAELGVTICDIWATSETPQGLLKVSSAQGSNHFDLDLSEYVKMVRTEDGGKAAYGTGELMLKGGAASEGYLSMGAIEPLDTDEDGFIATGDVFRKTEEGYFFLGRCKNIIVSSNGENVYPEELEMHFEHLATDAAQYKVIGIDNAPMLFVHPKAGEPAREELIEKIRATNSTLEIYKRIFSVYFASEPMPTGAKGVKANDLARDFAQHPERYQEVVLMKKRG